MSARSPHDPALENIIERYGRVGPQREAVRRAWAHFGDPVDESLFKTKFISSDPDDINEIKQVTAGVETLANHAGAICKAAYSLCGLSEGSERDVRGYIRAIARDGGMSQSVAEALVQLYRLRSRLQHSSLGVGAEDILESAPTTIVIIPNFMVTFAAWMERRGYPLT